MKAGRLVYFMGPSGAGKDTLLDWLRAHLPDDGRMHWARRTVSRAFTPGGEAHEAVTPDDFAAHRNANAFALHWEANGLGYGVRHEELAPLAHGHWVLVNGSRAYFPEALALHPDLIPVHITASADVLRGRLLARGRESPESIEARVQRAIAFSLPAGRAAIEIHYDRTVDDAGQSLLGGLARLPGWQSLRP